MKTFLFFTFLVSLAKSGLWITMGLLIKNHLEAAMSFITRKSIDDDFVKENNIDKLSSLTKWIGILIIIIGIGLALSAFATLIMGFKMPTNSFNFNF